MPEDPVMAEASQAENTNEPTPVVSSVPPTSLSFDYSTPQEDPNQPNNQANQQKTPDAQFSANVQDMNPLSRKCVKVVKI